MFMYLFFSCIFFIIVSCSGSSFTPLQLQLVNGCQVQLQIKCQNPEKLKRIIIYRTYINLADLDVLDLYDMPITKITFNGKSFRDKYIDSLVAHNCHYYYYVKAIYTDNSVIPSPIKGITIPNLIIPKVNNQRLSLFVDKRRYIIEVYFDRLPIKRYPISLGANPMRRKLHFDQQSTPEGFYQVSYLKRKSAFHKALGINYPNASDYARYHRAKKKKSLPLINGKIPRIGGSIQIHGGGIGDNWTWGCIAMRNADIDEIISLSKHLSGIPVYIAGYDIPRKEILGKILGEDN